MKFKIHLLRVVCCLLCVCCLLPFVASCKKETALPKNEPVLTADASGTLTYAADLDASLLQAHKKQTVSLFELLPGETIDAIAQKTPIETKKVSEKLRFTLSATDPQGASRLHNTYIARFSDGALLSDIPCSISNPADLAENQSSFPHENVAKGMHAANEELSAYLHSAHTLVEFSLADLLVESVNGAPRLVEASLIRLDEQIRAASRTSMQITLALTDCATHSLSDASASIDLLLARYADEEIGTVSAIILREDPEHPASTQRTATLLRFLHLSLRSRFANGQIYVALTGSAESISAQAKTLREAVYAIGGFSFGVALSPLAVTDSMQTDKLQTDILTLTDLKSLSDALFRELGTSASLALFDLAISAENEPLQAALITYSYRLALQCKADLVFYRSQTGKEFGLFDENGKARLAATAYRLADTAENVEGERLARELLFEDWKAVERARIERTMIIGVSNLGTTGDAGRRWFDFSSDKHPSFSTAGQGSEPATVRSELWNTQVLTASLSDGGTPDGSGYRFVSENSTSIQNLHAISANLLPQTPTAGRATVSLLIDGTATDGKALSYSSSINLDCNSWQTVTFHVRSFTALVDPDLPCTITLLMQPDEIDETGNFALWLHSFHTRSAESTSPVLWIALLSLAGFGIGAAIALFFFLFGKQKRRGNRKGSKA